MSSERTKAEGPIRLELLARPGIGIRLLDGSLQEITRGSDQLTLQLPVGLYMVEWSSNGRLSQEMILLERDDKERRLVFDPSTDSTTSEQAQPADKLFTTALIASLRPSERAYGSCITIFIEGDPGILRDAGTIGMRLLDREDVAMRAHNDADIGFYSDERPRSRTYQVRPGRYRVAFRSLLGETLALTVPALEGRTTLVFLRVAQSQLLVAAGERFANEISIGVEPARTIVVTVDGRESDYCVRERVRLAESMLQDLANNTNSITPAVLDVLADAKTDPLLRLYGACVLLADAERIQKDPKSRWSHEVSPTISAALERLRGVKDWIPDTREKGSPPDALAAQWKRKRLLSKPGASRPDESKRRVEVPPMLDCAWRWAIEQSIIDQDAVRRTASVAATGRSSGGTSPWLCWQLAATKAKPEALGKGSNLDELVAKLRELRVAEDSSEPLVQAGTSSLDPDIQTTLRQVWQMDEARLREPKTQQAELIDLAVALGLPARPLRSRLERTYQVVRPLLQVQPTPHGGGQNDTWKTQYDPPPALSRRIIDKDDPNKCRFGQQAEREGFALHASFDSTGSKNWTKVWLTVVGPASDDEQIEFYLHESFKKPVQRKEFRGGRAAYSATIWGGFTVGAWLPRRRVELELDLAAIEDAPKIVRER